MISSAPITAVTGTQTGTGDFVVGSDVGWEVCASVAVVCVATGVRVPVDTVGAAVCTVVVGVVPADAGVVAAV